MLPSKPKGKRISFSAIPITSVAPGALAAPAELVSGDLQIVPTMFQKRKAPVPKQPVAPQPAAAPQPPTVPQPAAAPQPLAAPKKTVAFKNTPEVKIFSRNIDSEKPQAQQPPTEDVAPQLQQAEPQPQQAEPQLQQPEPTAEEAPPLAPVKALKVRRPKTPKYSPQLELVKKELKAIENNDPYAEPPEAFVPQDRRGFVSFIVKTYGDFALPPKLGETDLEACQKLGAPGEDSAKMYLYQQFVREYVRQQSPYRGVLVYHGLGSGKTCSAIAASEAIYSTTRKKIIVMTPFSLQNNFITEITFCGFKHFRLQNHWVKVPLADDPTARLFAQEVMSIPESHFAAQKRAKKQEVIYVQDFAQPSNFDSLPDEDKTAIRDQIFAIIRSRITFIAYNGTRASQLKIWACSQPDFFDNAVIIIDEVHNLTRLMQGTIEPYLTETPKQKRKIAAEPVTPGKWKPKLCNVSANYKRAYLFYRLLCGAKNSKIIALSGTPLVNFPEELGILANVLHGYIDGATAIIPIRAGVPTSRVEAITTEVCRAHPRVDFYKLTSQQTSQELFFTIVPEGYKKVFDEANKFKGLEYVGLEGSSPNTIQELFEEVRAQLAAKGIQVSPQAQFASYPVLPPESEAFQERFIDPGNMTIQNEIVLSKRLSGLISYYRGSKEELMPRVTKDEFVPIPFTEYSIMGYLAARRYEMKEEEKKKETVVKASEKVVAAWSEVLAVSKMSNPSSYRFRSRAACNFVFPENVPRPYPDGQVDLEEELGRQVDVIGAQEADVAEDDAASVAAEEEDAAIERADGEDTPVPTRAPPSVIPYKQRIATVLATMRTMAKDILVLNPSEPGKHHLAEFSPKYAAILQKMQESSGSALVYSQFRTLEGIGLFGIALEGNGYIPIEVIGSEADPTFSPTTEESLRRHFQEGSTTAKNRYILYSGEETRERRNLLINLFNARLDRLPPKIVEVLRESGFEAIGNKRGDICKVISITGAGAEGLSLKNVRQVHIMEPFWNPVRTDQVKGRAVRICSHSDLPADERTVEVYTYCAVVSKEMIDKRLVDQTFLIQDGGITSDEFIGGISERKKKITESLLRIMKQSAVDCNLNTTENNTPDETIQCFRIKGTDDEFLYDPRLDEDIKETARSTRFAEPATVVPGATVPIATPASVAPAPASVQRTVREIKGKQYIEDPRPDGSRVLYDIKNRLLERPVGKRSINPETGKFKTELYPPVS